MIRNSERERIRSKCTARELAEAMKALRLDEVPPEHRAKAVASRLAEVMLATTTDPRERSKDGFQQAAYLHAALNRDRAPKVIAPTLIVP